MGAGRSHEAEFTLRGDIPAGRWTFVGDGIITASVDVTFELLLRDADGDTTLATWSRHFDPRGGGDFDAVPFEVTADVVAVEVGDGNPEGVELVLRYAGTGTEVPMAYVPNGEGANANGRIPNLRLP
ncbi:MAG: hypothetical protein R2939_14030 [Kofleriaceae bacterium]